MEEEKGTDSKKPNDKNNSTRYTFNEDLAIVNYMVTESRFLKSCGIDVWRNAEKLQICPGRSYLSMKERFRKVIVKNLKVYKVEKDVAMKITQFMRANSNGKQTIRLKHST